MNFVETSKSEVKGDDNGSIYASSILSIESKFWMSCKNYESEIVMKPQPQSFGESLTRVSSHAVLFAFFSLLTNFNRRESQSE